MKKALLMATMLAALILSSCSKNGDFGNLSFSIAGDVLITDQTKSKVSDFTTVPESSEFTVTVTDESGNEAWSGKLKDLPGSKLVLKTGNYTASASYGSATEEGVDKPYFAGRTSFAVTGGASTHVTIPVELKNCIVTIATTDIFKKYFTSYTFTMKTGAGNTFTFTQSESKAVFMDAFRFELEGALVNQGGTNLSFARKSYENLYAATCYTVRFDASQVGGMKITISFNNNVETVDLGTIELND